MEMAVFLPLCLTASGRSLADEKSATGIVLDEAFADFHIEPGHPESPGRYRILSETIRQSGILGRLTLLKPVQDVLPAIQAVHSREHISSIMTNLPQAHQAAMLATGGMLSAVRAVCSGQITKAFCPARPPGHHALNTGREEGFCFYNHIAIAARYAQLNFGLQKILIVDWDYHHGNGTQAMFYADPSVLFFSSHDTQAYPGTGHASEKGIGEGYGYTINVPLGCGITDEQILAAYRQQLIPAADAFKPDLVLVSAGFDSRVDDRLGCFSVTDAGFAALTNLVMDIADRHCQGRLVSLLEGGYNLQGNASAALSHVRALLEGQA